MSATVTQTFQRLFFALIVFVIAGTHHRIRAQERIIVNTIHEEENMDALLKDTSLIHAMATKAMSIQHTAPDSCIMLAKKVIKLSLLHRYSDGIAMGLIDIGAAYYNKGNIEQCKLYTQKAYPFCQRSIFRRTEALRAYYRGMAAASLMQARYDSAIYWNHKRLQLIDPEALLYPEKLIQLFIDLGGAWSSENHEKSLQYYLLAKKIAEKKQEQYLPQIYYSLSGLYYKKKQTDSSRMYANMGLQLLRKYPNPSKTQFIFFNLGETFIQTDPLKAISYFDSALAIHTSNMLSGVIRPNIGLARAYINLGRYEQAIKHATIALTTVQHVKLEGTERHAIYECLSTAAAGLKNYSDAFSYKTLAANLNDSLTSKEKSKAANEMEIKYQTYQKDKEISDNKLLIAHQRTYIERKNTWIGIISSGAFLLTVISLLLYRNNHHRQNLQDEKFRVMAQEQEIALLKAMMKGEERERIRIGRELHDGVGGLLSAVKLNFSTIQHEDQLLAERADFIRALKLVDETTSELRKTAHNLMPEVLLNGGLETAVVNFCKHISKTKKPEIHVLSYGLIPRMDLSFELSVYRIVQELINNVIKHAHASQAILQLNWQEHAFLVTIEDDGAGIPVEKMQQGAGIGISNIHARVRALEGHIELESNVGSGTTVYLQFAIEKIKLATA